MTIKNIGQNSQPPHVPTFGDDWAKALAEDFPKGTLEEKRNALRKILQKNDTLSATSRDVKSDGRICKFELTSAILGDYYYDQFYGRESTTTELDLQVARNLSQQYGYDDVGTIDEVVDMVFPNRP